jgi:hypothetical protein
MIKSDLRLLIKYLINQEIVDPVAARIEIKFSWQQDMRNDQDPRGFAMVMSDKLEIHVAEAINSLPPEYRIGILLHELAHLVADTFLDEDSEVDTDLWILASVPESGYSYGNVSYVLGDTKKVAKNLQKVSEKFLEIIGV